MASSRGMSTGPGKASSWFRNLTGVGGGGGGGATSATTSKEESQQETGGAAGAAGAVERGKGSGSRGYNSNENTIKIADPSVAVFGREESSRAATTSAGNASAIPCVATGESGSGTAAGGGDASAPSESTRKRAEATKQYLESLYQQRKSRDRAKQERRDSLEKQLKLERRTNTEIQARLKELDVRCAN